MLRIVTEDQTQAAQVPETGTVSVAFPPGHYYSPIPDDRELRREPRFSQLWPAEPRETPGIDWRDEQQVALCREVFATQERTRFSDVPTPNPAEFYLTNGAYPPLDAWILEGMLRTVKPKRMIEVGSGYSSLVTAAINRQYLGYDLTFTCIEPEPKQFLVDGVAGIDDLIVKKVQDVPLELYSELGDGDVLFIDTSHTVKTGGDVPWLFNQVVPRLAPGVYVHIHDIFLPREYLQKWVFDGRGWNEQYLVQSFLAFNSAFEIVFGTSWMQTHHPEEIAAAFPDLQRFAQNDGGSLWIRRCGGSGGPLNSD